LVLSFPLFFTKFRCANCQKFAPEYEKAAQKLKFAEPKPISLAKVDASQESDLAKNFSVTSFPTFKLFKKGKVFDSEDDWDAEGLYIF